MRHEDNQRGSIAPIVALCGVVMALLAIGTVGTARLVHARWATQRAADALSLAAVLTGGDIANSSQVARLNLRQVPELTARCIEEPERFVCRASATTWLPLPALLFGSDRFRVTAAARASVPQTTVRASRTAVVPQPVLVLDYSASMAGHRHMMLAQGIRALLDSSIEASYGAVLFGTDVLASVEIGDDSVPAIKQELARTRPEGRTSTGLALDRAGELFSRVGRGPSQYVVLVSDGIPTNPSAALEAAQRLWDAGLTIVTVHIFDHDWRDPGAVDAPRLMRSLSGSPDNRGDGSYYYLVRDAEELPSQLMSAFASISCPISPLPKDAVDDNGRVRVWLRPASGGPGVELAEIPPDAPPERFEHELGFRYNPPTRQVVLTTPACDAAADSGEEIVVRYNYPRLIPLE